MVQLPEPCDENSEAYKAGYKNICEIGKERIRRAGRKIKEEAGMLGDKLDIGFRVLKCDSSNMKDVYYNPNDYKPDMFDTLTDNIKPDRTPEDLLFQVMLDLGVLLSSKIEETKIAGKRVFNVADGFLIACFEKEMQITHTYRNSQELIDIAGNFVQKNPSQIKKRLISPKSLPNPIEVIGFDDGKGYRKNWGDAVEKAVGRIVAEFGEKSSILMIGRYNFDRDQLIRYGEFESINEEDIRSKKYTKAKIKFLTAHSSKGLGFDNVILVNMVDNKFGFPSQLEDDPIMKLVIYNDNTIPFAEERRLFYVAMTRTKNKVYMVTAQNRPSQFVLELIHDYNIPHDTDLNNVVNNAFAFKCPLCGSKLKYENNKNYGLGLYMCTNDPEICDFMTNDRVVLADIYKCPECSDGYMIVKPGNKKGTYFYGCTNFRKSPSCKATAQIDIKNNKT